MADAQIFNAPNSTILPLLQGTNSYGSSGAVLRKLVITFTAGFYPYPVHHMTLLDGSTPIANFWVPTNSNGTYQYPFVVDFDIQLTGTLSIVNVENLGMPYASGSVIFA